MAGDGPTQSETVTGVAELTEARARSPRRRTQPDLRALGRSLELQRDFL